jgi:hypothetical protein
LARLKRPALACTDSPQVESKAHRHPEYDELIEFPYRLTLVA